MLILPFAMLLLAIAIMPFLHRHWWERHYAKVSVGLGLITASYYAFVLGDPVRMLHLLEEYGSFMALIGSLFVVAGGIHVRVAGAATPPANACFLFLGAILASLIGTTGASMLLIRPWIRLNQNRIQPFHIIFFIFIVSNVGGCLTPIGDPPLFLGYLKGVPFWWVLEKCWPAWLVGASALIAVFLCFDHRNFRKMPSTHVLAPGRWTIHGLHNLVFLALVLVAVFIRNPPFLGEGLMLAAAAASYFTTPQAVHAENNFNFHPMQEVGWLFLGIFLTMAPALDYLELHARDLALSSNAAFFWLTGGLSAALDNAPTYLTFLAAALGRRDLSLADASHVQSLLQTHPHEVVAISLGAVFFGAVTYIGNGPNFMVKAVAERSGVRMPGFFAYVAYYALPILLPLLALISLLYFSRWSLF